MACVRACVHARVGIFITHTYTVIGVCACAAHRAAHGGAVRFTKRRSHLKTSRKTRGADHELT